MRIILATGRWTASGAKNDENCESSCKPGRFPRRPGVNEQWVRLFGWLTSFGYIHIWSYLYICIYVLYHIYIYAILHVSILKTSGISAWMMISYAPGCWYICPHYRLFFFWGVAMLGKCWCASTMEWGWVWWVGSPEKPVPAVLLLKFCFRVVNHRQNQPPVKYRKDHPPLLYPFTIFV